MDTTLVMNPATGIAAPYDPMKDFAAITLTAKNTSILSVRAADGPKDIKDLIARAKAKPGKMNYGAGIITTRLSGYLFAQLAGIDVVLIPYKGSADVVQGLLTGSVDFIIDGVASGLPLIQAGKFRALAKLNDRPLPQLPNLHDARRRRRPAEARRYFELDRPRRAGRHAARHHRENPAGGSAQLCRPGRGRKTRQGRHQCGRLYAEGIRRILITPKRSAGARYSRTAGSDSMKAFAAIVVAITALAGPAQAQQWPSKPVKIVVAFGPGGSADQFGRLLAAELSETFKQHFYVENRPGNSGSIGSAAVARAEADGYTLLIGGSGPHITGPAINPNIGYDPLKDFTHIAMIGADSYVLVANPALGVKNIGELVKLAQSRKEAITSSSTGPGSLGQLILEQFKREAGIDILHVPAPNSGVIDVLGNHISMTITTLLTVGEQIKAEKVVALGVTSLKRNPVFSEIPTFAEQGYPSVHGDTWFWLAARRIFRPTSSTSSIPRSGASWRRRKSATISPIRHC